MQFSLFRFPTLFLFLIFLPLSVFSQQIQPDSYIKLDEHDHAEICIFHPTDIDAHYKYAPEISLRKNIPNAAENATFQLDYKSDCNGEVWPQKAQTAFEYAASIWESHLESTVPIRIEANWVALGEDILGRAGPTTLFSLTGDGVFPNTFYTIAQASALTELDLVEEFDDINYDIVVDMNCEFPDWYLETDANPPSGTLDAVTVLLHEIGHGIGFTGSMSGDRNSEVANWGVRTQNGGSFPIVFDQFTLEGSFRQLIDENLFPKFSNDLYDALVGREGGVYFSGTEAEFANNDMRIPLYSPSPWAQGSSYSHFDQFTFGNTENALMRPQLDQASAIHSPGPVFCGLLQDIGWPLGQACIDLIPEEGFLDRPDLASPFNGQGNNSTNPTLAWNPVEGATEYRVQLASDFSFDELLVDQTISNNSFAVNEDLEFSSLYFWRVQALSASGNSKFSSKFRFRTAQRPPRAITLFAPEDGATQVRPGFQLSWQSDNRAEEYEIHISKEEDFSPLTFNRTVDETRFSRTQNFDFSTTYFWRIRGINSAGVGEWSETRSFTTIIEKPEPVTLSSPMNNEGQVQVSTVFTWQESLRAFEYVIQVSEDENFTSETLIELTSEEETVTVNTPLEYAKIYYWRVKATNVGGESEYTDPQQFTTVVQETAILPNYPNPFNASTTVRFELSQSSDVRLDLFDSVGRRVATIVDGERPAGVYFERIQANAYASGTYFIRFVAGDFMEVQKMAIIK